MRHREWLLAIVLMLAANASLAEAAVGDVRRTIGVPLAAQCSTGPGTALTVVPGGKAGFPTIPILLVTSCVAFSEGGTSTLLIFFIAPGADEDGPSVVRTLSTAFPSTAAATTKPTSGWEALVLRADKGDILGCGTNGTKTVLWSLDFSPFNAVVDGVASFLRNGPTGSSCASVAWDSSDRTFYQTPASGFNILHFKEDGTALSAIPVAPATCNTAITGLGIAGTSLFVACRAPVEGSATITQLAKSSGSGVRPSFVYPESVTLRGVPDDPTTLAFEFNELIWALGESAELVGFEMAGGTVGQKRGAPVLTPGTCPGGNVASDGDGLLDCWKSRTIWPDGLPGISYASVYDGNVANRDLVLCVPNPPVNVDADCAKPGTKALFLEIDYMQFHRPTDAAVANVKATFAGAPTPPGPVALHVLVNEQISFMGSSHYNNLAFVPCTGPATTTDRADFDAIKALFFGTVAERNSANAVNAKALVFRYALFVHNLLGLGTTSGCGEILGNDFVVAMGSWGSQNFGTASKPIFHNVGSLDQLQGTFLHELGHTLGLRHGGGDNINCKPNYPSVMSYTSQFSTPISPTGVRPLDFSRGQFGVPVILPDGTGMIGLDKAALDEGFGIGPAYTGPIAFGPVPLFGTPTTAIAGGAVNWSKTGSASEVVSLDIAQTTNASGGCAAAQPGPPDNPDGRFLPGFNDWENLQFNFRASVDVADGAHITAGEPVPFVDPVTGELVARLPGVTFEEHLAFIFGLTDDAIDIKPGDKDNKINPSSSQTIDVAILSRPDAPGVPGLDATTVDPATLRLMGMAPDTTAPTWTVLVKQSAGSGLFHCVTRDVNHDGLQDLVCLFDLPKGLVGPGESRALLQGQTFAGQPVLASDVFQQ